MGWCVPKESNQMASFLECTSPPAEYSFLHLSGPHYGASTSLVWVGPLRFRSIPVHVIAGTDAKQAFQFEFPDIVKWLNKAAVS